MLSLQARDARVVTVEEELIADGDASLETTSSQGHVQPTVFAFKAGGGGASAMAGGNSETEDTKRAKLPGKSQPVDADARIDRVKSEVAKLYESARQEWPIQQSRMQGASTLIHFGIIPTCACLASLLRLRLHLQVVWRMTVRNTCSRRRTSPMRLRCTPMRRRLDWIQRSATA